MMTNPEMGRSNEYELTDLNAIRSAEINHQMNNDMNVIDGMTDEQLRRAVLSNNIVIIPQQPINNLQASNSVLEENRRSMDIARGLDPDRPQKDGVNGDDDDEDEEAEDGDLDGGDDADAGDHVNFFKRTGRKMKRGTIRFVRGTRYFLFHSDRKGRLFFCGNTLGFWFKSVLYLAILYGFLFLVFVCMLQLASVIQGVRFIPFASNRD